MFNIQNITEFLIGLLYMLPAIVISLSVHELMHGMVAYSLGDPTAKNAGRLTLNPLSHFDPIGFLMLVFVRFGYAKPVPINARYFKHQKSGIVLCSIAGPLSNIIMAFIGFNLMGLIIMFSQKLNSTLTLVLLNFLYYFVVLNLNLAIFNLIPISPLDGSKVLYSLLPDRIYYKILQYEQYGFIIIVALLFVGGFDSILQKGITFLFRLNIGLVSNYFPELVVQKILMNF